MKPLISILSCHKFYARRIAQRETWLKDHSGFDYRFFVGRDNQPARTEIEAALPSDVVALDCDDSYNALPEKVQKVAAWALRNSYQHAFKCDDDTYVVPERLMASGFEQHDYSGFIEDRDCHLRAFNFPVYPHGAGGPGYWLSRESLEIVANGLPGKPQEDFGVGEVLTLNGIHAFHDDRYCHQDIPVLRERILESNFISLHKCDPQEMRRVHAQVKSFCPIGAE